MERRRQAVLLALPAALALLVFFLIPMAYILLRTVRTNGFADFIDFFTDPFYLDILWTTLRWGIRRPTIWPGPGPGPESG